MNTVGEPDEGKPHVRFDEGRLGRLRLSQPPTLPDQRCLTRSEFSPPARSHRRDLAYLHETPCFLRACRGGVATCCGSQVRRSGTRTTGIDGRLNDMGR